MADRYEHYSIQARMAFTSLCGVVLPDEGAIDRNLVGMISTLTDLEKLREVLPHGFTIGDMARAFPDRTNLLRGR